MRIGPRRLAPLTVAIALALASVPAYALSLGEIEVTSSLGQPLRARVPVSASPGEDLSADCISVVRSDPFGGDSQGLIASARVELRKIAGKNLLLVSSALPVEEPVARLLLRVSCTDGGSIYRDYTLLLDPPQYQTARAAPLQLPQAPPPPQNRYTQQLFSGIDEHVVQEGDTLDSIVKNRYPYNPRLQRRLRKLIASANSDVLPTPESPLPATGTPLLIPELPVLAQEVQAPKAKPKARRGATRPAKPKPQIALPQAETEPLAAAPQVVPPSGGRPEFVLRLSRSSIDVSRPVSEDERASLRERQRLLDADDLTATMLSLQHEMRQMRAEVEALKAQLRQQGGSLEGASPAATPVTPPAAVAKPDAATVPETSAPKWYEQWTPLAERWWWVLPVAALGGLLLAMLRRRRSSRIEEAFDAPIPAPHAMTQAPTIAPTQAPVTVAPKPAAERIEAAHQAREQDVQARYLADRFPELAEADIALSDTDAVVEQSRVYFMEDGAADKAIELLEYTTAKYPDQPKPWLALLEIYRQMKMKGAFEKQAIAFRDRFRDIGEWRKVQAIGRALDPQNELYAAEPGTESQEEAVAAEQAPSGQTEGDQLRAQNWLDIPLDFTPALRGEKLRSELLSELPEDRPEPKVPGQSGAPVLDFDFDFDSDQAQKERVEPKLARKPAP